MILKDIRRIVTFVIALMLSSLFKLPAYGVDSCESRPISMLFESILMSAEAENLRSQIHFKHPHIGMEIPLESFLITDKSSEVTLQLKVLSQMQIPPSEVLNRLQKLDTFFEVTVSNNGDFFVRIPETTAYILRNAEGDDFLSNFQFFVGGYKGNICISTDSDIISQIAPGQYILMYFEEFTKEGYVRNGYKHKGAELGLFLSVNKESVDDYNAFRVTGVLENSLAAKAGIRPNDLIIKINDKAFSDWDQFDELLKEAKVSKNLQFTIYRSSEILNMRIY